MISQLLLAFNFCRICNFYRRNFLPVSLREQTQVQLFVFAYLQRIWTPSRHSARRSRSPSTLMSASLRRFHSNRYRSPAAAVIVQSAGLLRREVTTSSRPIWICQSSPVSVVWIWIERGLLTFGARRGRGRVMKHDSSSSTPSAANAG